MNLPTPEIPKKEQTEINSLVQQVDQWQAFEVKTHDDCQAAADALNDYKARVKNLDERRKMITKPLDDAKKSVMDLFRPATDALGRLERILKPKIDKFLRAERERQQREQAEAAERARKERERLEAKADKLREKGKDEQADAVEQQALSTVAAPAAVPDQKISGVSQRVTWKGEVTDIREFCRAIADGKIPTTVVNFQQRELDRLAALYRDQTSLPGFRASSSSSVATRSR